MVVRKKGKKYELIAGHRRVAAVQSIDWAEVPAIVREESAERAYLLTLVENLQRDDLTPREEADALAELVRARNWSTHQVADAINRSQAYVSKRIRVFDDELLRPAVLEHRLTVSAAEELLALPPERRRVILEEAVAQGWDQAMVRAAVREELGVTQPGARRAPPAHAGGKSAQAAAQRAPGRSLGYRSPRAGALVHGPLHGRPSAPHARVFPALPEVSPSRPPSSPHLMDLRGDGEGGAEATTARYKKHDLFHSRGKSS